MRIFELKTLLTKTPTANHYRADGANHNEETATGSAVQGELRKCFDGSRGAQDFFTTPVR